MGSSDWAAMTNVLASGDLARGVTSGPTKPNGGGTFCYGMHSRSNTPGSLILYATPQAPNTNFNPLVLGGEITGAVCRAVSAGAVDWAAYLYILAQGNDVSDEAYLLGLSDGDPCHIELRKGVLHTGLPDEAPDPVGTNGILRRSTATIAPGEWVHLRLEVVVNASGDVVLNCYQNDLTANAVTAPSWAAIPGMAQFIDDALGVATGSLPYIAGRAGFGGRFDDISRRAYFDHLTLAKQV